jgi:hypothetical protein
MMESHIIPDEHAPPMTEELAKHLHCYICGNDDAYELREIEEPVIVGQNTAFVPVHAAVCRFCGEHVYDLPNRARLEHVRNQLARGDVAGFKSVGATYRVP